MSGHEKFSTSQNVRLDHLLLVEQLLEYEGVKVLAQTGQGSTPHDASELRLRCEIRIPGPRYDIHAPLQPLYLHLLLVLVLLIPIPILGP